MAHVLCRVVWAEEYRSIKENKTFFPGNMKHPAKHHSAHEILNFSDENGYVYGFVENNDSWIKLEKLGASTDADDLNGVTVVWCALDKATRRLRVVGWYDNAIAFREPQIVHRNSTPGIWHFQFKAKTEDAHLIPSTERYLEVPMRTKRTDKGFIGQRNWHFPDRSEQYEQFIEAFSLLRYGQEQPVFQKSADRQTFEEGQRSIAETTLVIRNPKLVAAAKERYGYKCQVCAFSFEERYGKLGQEFIEVHHLSPVASRKGKRTVTTDDVRVVCANCHRMIHRRKKPLELFKLKALLK